MHTHTIPDSVLRQLLEDAITAYDGPGIFAFSKGACTDRFQAARKVMNDLPELLRIYQAENEADTDNIPFSGEPVVYETDDNVSPSELGL